MADTLAQRVFRFTADRLHRSIFELTPQTELRRDGGLDGPAAADFFLAFGNEFGVDLSEFHKDRYFHRHGQTGFLNPETWPFAIMAVFATILVGRRKVHLQPVTIQDLIHAAASGKWAHGTS